MKKTKKIKLLIGFTILILIFSTVWAINSQKSTAKAYTSELKYYPETVKLLELLLKYDQEHDTNYSGADYETFNYDVGHKTCYRTSYFMVQGSCISPDGKYGYYMLQAYVFNSKKQYDADDVYNKQPYDPTTNVNGYNFRSNILIITNMEENLSNNTLKIASIANINSFKLIGDSTTTTEYQDRSKCGHANSLTYVPDVTLNSNDEVVKSSGNYLLATPSYFAGCIGYTFMKPVITPSEGEAFTQIQCKSKKMYGLDTSVFKSSSTVNSMAYKTTKNNALQFIIMHGTAWQIIQVPFDSSNKLNYSAGTAVNTATQIPSRAYMLNSERLGIQGMSYDGKCMYILYSYHTSTNYNAGKLTVMNADTKAWIGTYDISDIGKKPESMNQYVNSNGNVITYINFQNDTLGKSDRGYRVKLTIPACISYFKTTTATDTCKIEYAQSGSSYVVDAIEGDSTSYYKIKRMYDGKFFNGYNSSGNAIWSSTWNGYKVKSGTDIKKLNTGYRAGIRLYRITD